MTFKEIDLILRKYFQAGSGNNSRFACYYIDYKKFSPSVYVGSYSTKIKTIFKNFKVDNEFPFTLDIGFSSYREFSDSEVTIENIEKTCNNYIQRYKILTNETELKRINAEFKE